MLKSLSFAFPAGGAGAALLLLRAVFGLAVVLEGRSYVGGPNPSGGAWVLGLAAFAAGGLLIVGFLAPIVGCIVAAGVLGVAFSLLPAPQTALFDSTLAYAFSVTMLVTIIAVGPGAFSVDGRLFGGREIIIPPAVQPSASDE